MFLRAMHAAGRVKSEYIKERFPFHHYSNMLDVGGGMGTYAVSFGENIASYVSFAMFFISGIVALLLVYLGVFSWVFLILFMIIWLYTLSYSYRLVKADKNKMKDLGLLVGRKGFNYFLIAYDLMFLDIFYRLVQYHL